MSDKIQCAIHGEAEQTFVCSHLVGEAVGLGFNRNEPTDEDPFPDAWCDDCELIRTAHNGWTDEAQKLAKIALLCSGCYQRCRIRNTRTSLTLDKLDRLRWKCATCEEGHTGPCLDFSYDAPYYLLKEHQEAREHVTLQQVKAGEPPETFLDEDYCVIEDDDFFVRGLINLPILGTAETLRWGVWGSLSRQNFETLWSMNEDPQRVELPPMFSWLSTQIPEYPDTLNLKMYAHIQPPGCRPIFELEASDHPLSQEYHSGITPLRVREIMTQQLRGL